MGCVDSYKTYFIPSYSLQGGYLSPLNPTVIYSKTKEETAEKYKSSKKGKIIIKWIIKELHTECLQDLTADICLILLEAKGKTFYLNTS